VTSANELACPAAAGLGERLGAPVGGSARRRYGAPRDGLRDLPALMHEEAGEASCTLDFTTSIYSRFCSGLRRSGAATQ